MAAARDEAILARLGALDTADPDGLEAALPDIFRAMSAATGTAVWIAALAVMTRYQESCAAEDGRHCYIMPRPISFATQAKRDEYVARANGAGDETAAQALRENGVVSEWNKQTLGRGKYAGKIGLACARDNLVFESSAAYRMIARGDYETEAERQRTMEECARRYEYDIGWHCVAVLHAGKSKTLYMFNPAPLGPEKLETARQGKLRVGQLEVCATAAQIFRDRGGRNLAIDKFVACFSDDVAEECVHRSLGFVWEVLRASRRDCDVEEVIREKYSWYEVHP